MTNRDARRILRHLAYIIPNGPSCGDLVRMADDSVVVTALANILRERLTINTSDLKKHDKQHDPSR